MRCGGRQARDGTRAATRLPQPARWSGHRGTAAGRDRYRPPRGSTRRPPEIVGPARRPRCRPPRGATRSFPAPLQCDEPVLALSGRHDRVHPHERLPPEHLLELSTRLRVLPATTLHLAVVAGQGRDLALQNRGDQDDRRDLFVRPGQLLEGLALANVVFGRGLGIAGATPLLLLSRPHPCNRGTWQRLVVLGYWSTQFRSRPPVR